MAPFRALPTAAVRDMVEEALVMKWGLGSDLNFRPGFYLVDWGN